MSDSPAAATEALGAAATVGTDRTPRQIVAELDKHIVGQHDAKRAVAIAIRNRWRRRRLGEELRKEVTPKNIVMIGPTGCGKTEIARRLAGLVGAPFVKVEASKYTEVGYHGRDVESLIRDLVEAGIRLVRAQEREKVVDDATRKANDRLVDLLLPPEEDDDEATVPNFTLPDKESPAERAAAARKERAAKRQKVRERLRERLRAGKMEESVVRLRTERKAVQVQMFSGMGMENMDFDMQNILDKVIPKESKDRDMTVAAARRYLVEQEVDRLIDKDLLAERAVELAEESGIVFLDEIDKICGPPSSHGPDVSRQGVQRDLLPIVEGTTVQTRHGPVRTDHILFVAAGAFHVSKPADMMPELQGRFPIRVELKELGHEDFVRILREPKNSLTRQYVQLLATEGVEVTFADDAVEEIARFAQQVNSTTHNIGARRLHTILETILDEVSFDADGRSGQSVAIDAAYVTGKLAALAADDDLSRYML